MALVCHRWRNLEHSSRSSFRLRGNVSDLFLPTTFCFPSLTHISPWGHPFLHHRNPIIDDHQHLIAFLLRRAFPNVSSLAFDALQALAPLWPALRHAKLVRWHQRHSHHPHGADLAASPSLAHLDISHFYCWAENVPEALHAFSAAAASLIRLNLISAAVLGFGASELVRISAACPNLRHLLAPCIFDPRYIDFVGDDALLAVAANCPGLSLLHLADPSAVSRAAHPQPEAEGFAPHDARITAAGLEALFGALPVLEELALDLCHNVRDAGRHWALSQRCYDEVVEACGGGCCSLACACPRGCTRLLWAAGVVVHPQLS